MIHARHAFFALALALGLAACQADGPAAQRGAGLIARSQCGACHEIPGIEAAQGLVGPPLAAFSRRTTIAGVLANTPDNLARFVARPQSTAPGGAMPDMGLTEAQAQDVAAYLEALR